MRADAILLAEVPTTSPIQHDPTEAVGLTPIDQVRRQVARALFGELVPPPQVGRFQVAKILGTGGMGVVYEAHDPQLGRKVALKLLQPMTSGGRARERLLREAQAMAQLQHPNVVGVYEAGVHGDQVYIAMEYVENGTLGEWLRVRPRTWQEVVDMLLQAGEGLTAAHAAGLVHRDFKPANILIGSGRARISDFGLARTTATAEDLERTAEDSSGMLLGAPLTRTGSLLGTPAYMAPEQLRGEPATAASDQFAFGVVLYESLYGHRPFQGDSLGALMQAIDQGKIARPERKLSLPAKVSAVIRRALARDSSQRYPNMASLLEALRAARRARWAAPVLGVGLSGAAMVGGLALLFMQSSASPTDATGEALVVACGGEDALAGVWDKERQERVRWALGEEGGPRVLAGLDEYAAKWKEHNALRCAGKVSEPRWTDTCLADRRTALGDLAQAIVEAPGPLRAGASGVVSMLPALEDCPGPAKPAVLVSDMLAPVRMQAWQVRMAIAGAFSPHVAANAPTFYRSGLSQSTLEDLQRLPRLGMEMKFAEAVQWMRPDTIPRAAWEARLLSPFERDKPRLPRDPLPTLVTLGHEAAEAGHDDLAARNWVLAAELLEAGRHTDAARKEAWEGAETALRKLSSEHPLRARLTRDLAYFQLVHARHTTQPGTCAGVGADFEACSAVFSAIKNAKVVGGTTDALPADRELLARAHEHAGEVKAAASHREGHEDYFLDESAIGYLDFAAGEVVPDAPPLGESLHCNPDATVCQIDPEFAAMADKDVSLVTGNARLMPSVKDGVVRGMKFYGLRPENGLKLLGFRNGDLIAAIDGSTADTQDPAVFLRSFARVLARGGTLTIDRKGEVTTRKFEVR